MHRACALLLAAAVAVAGLPARAASATDMTVADLQARYPGLSLHPVTPDEYRALVANPRVMAQVITDTPLGRRDSLDPDEDLSPSGRPPVLTPPPTVTNHDYSLGSVWLDGAGSINSRDAAIVVFVLAGTVVIAAAVIYPILFITSALLGPDDLPPVWWEAGARAQFFSGASQQGYMGGAALAFGFADEEADVGIVLEGGYLDADIVTLDGREVSVAGRYVMAGPSVRWRMDEGPQAPRLESELLAGTAAHYDLISRASFAFTWSLRGAWRGGLRAGAVYLDVAEDEGPVWQAGDDFNLLVGLESSCLF